MIVAALLAALTAAPPATPAAQPAAASFPVEERTLRLLFVGDATVYLPSAPVDRAVLFVSGDDGWSKGVLDMARRAASGGAAVVAGLSYPRLRRASLASNAPCWYPAGDLEVIGQALEKQLQFPEYTRPILIGYSSGATIVYASLAAAPESFAGGMSLGFCPDLEGVPPLCSREGFRPAYDARRKRADLPRVEEIASRWEVLQGSSDVVCRPKAITAFAGSLRNARLSFLAGVGHGFGNPRKWGEAFDRGLREMAPAPQEAAGRKPAPAGPGIERDLEELDLPLVLRLAGRPRAFLLFISGDGGWSSFDRALTDVLAEHGVSTVALNTLKYFWNEKPPGQVAADLWRLIGVCRRDGLPLFAGGYSFGAEVLPVVLDRSEFTGVFAGLVMIAPGPSASFEVSVLDWLRTKEKPTPYRVVDHTRALGDLPALCVAGEKDEESICSALGAGARREVVLIPGAHHFSGKYRRVGDAAAAFIERLLARAPSEP